MFIKLTSVSKFCDQKERSIAINVNSISSIEPLCYEPYNTLIITNQGVNIYVKEQYEKIIELIAEEGIIRI